MQSTWTLSKRMFCPEVGILSIMVLNPHYNKRTNSVRSLDLVHHTIYSILFTKRWQIQWGLWVIWCHRLPLRNFCLQSWPLLSSIHCLCQSHVDSKKQFDFHWSCFLPMSENLQQLPLYVYYVNTWKFISIPKLKKNPIQIMIRRCLNFLAVYNLDRAVFCQNGLSQKSFPPAFMILLTKAETTIFTLSQS